MGIDGGRAFTWASERDGWRRVYTLHCDGREPTPLSPGQVDVITVRHVDAAGGWILFLASPLNATQSYLYRSPFNAAAAAAAAAERLTPEDQPGTHSYEVAPNGQWAIHTWSRADVPPATEIVEFPSHRTVRTLQDNTTLRLKLAAWHPSPTEFGRVPLDGGIEMDAWIMKPPGFDQTKKYPVLVFVYGATALRSWTPGPWPRPRPVPQGARGCRLAVWGKSAGGTAALNLLFRRPDLYRAGIALAPVPDPALANAWYQETFMRTPEENPEGYRDGSPMGAVDPAPPSSRRAVPRRTRAAGASIVGQCRGSDCDARRLTATSPTA